LKNSNSTKKWNKNTALLAADFQINKALTNKRTKRIVWTVVEI